MHHPLIGVGSSVPSTFEQLDLLRMAFDTTDDYFLLLQLLFRHDGQVDDLLILEANQAACRYMRQEREAIVGQTLLTIFPQMQLNSLMDLCIDAAERNTPATINDFAYQNHEFFQGQSLLRHSNPSFEGISGAELARCHRALPRRPQPG